MYVFVFFLNICLFIYFKDYRLDFGGPYSDTWCGHPATVVPHEGKHVWGAIWEVDNSNILDLDR